jgi:hypothetical protein
MAGFVTAHAHDRAEGSTTAAFVGESPCQFTTFEAQTSFTRLVNGGAEFAALT